MTGTSGGVPTGPNDRATNAYYLVESNGAVSGYAGAQMFGSRASRTLSSPVVASAAVPGGHGYWLLTASGNLYVYGSAVHFGKPWMAPHSGSFVGLATTPDGAGLWAVTSGGTVLSYGDAPNCGAPAPGSLSGSVTGIVPTRDGKGYWLFTSNGNLYPFGNAVTYGDAPSDGSPLIGLAPTVDDGGYWLAYADGYVAAFGDAVTYGSLSSQPPAPVVSIAGLRDGEGYWLTTSTGQVYAFGRATAHGSLAPAPPSGVSVVALVPTTSKRAAASGTTGAPPGPLPPPVLPLKGDPYVHGSMGYDVSSFQCNKHNRAVRQAKLPRKTALAVVQVAGWLDSATNPCLSSLLSWAHSAAKPHDPTSLYLFLNAPTVSPSAGRQDATGPAGNCAHVARGKRASCRAYNYGYNGAERALRYAASRGARLRLWWLDVEGGRAPGASAQFARGEYWAHSKALNDRTIEGAINALRKEGITVGIYSSSLQYANIAGNYVPRGPRIPLWVAGVPWTNPPFGERGLPGKAVLRAWCAGTAHYAGSKRRDLFAGGVPWLLQETPGSLPSPYGIDPDYAC